MYGGGVKLIDNSFVGYPEGVYAENGEDYQIINNYFDLHGAMDLKWKEEAHKLEVTHLSLMALTAMQWNFGTIIFLTSIAIPSSQIHQIVVEKAFVVTGGASPIFNSNLIYGFGTLLGADSDVYTLKFNLGYEVDNMFTGDGIPDQAGTVATVNYNGDAADIYGNLNLDPDFVDLDLSQDFSSESPLVNGGDVDS